MIAIPRGKYLGKASERSAEGEAEHFIRCLACGGWMDCRDLAQVFDPKGRCRTRREVKDLQSGLLAPWPEPRASGKIKKQRKGTLMAAA
jgi:hypothetical protein